MVNVTMEETVVLQFLPANLWRTHTTTLTQMVITTHVFKLQMQPAIALALEQKNLYPYWMAINAV